jgi:hypothetical protein
MRSAGRTGASQNTIRNNEVLLIQLPRDAPDGLTWWLEQYFRFEVTIALSSQKVQRRDLELFLRFGVSALFLQTHTLTKKASDGEILTRRFQRSFTKAFSATNGE